MQQENDIHAKPCYKSLYEVSSHIHIHLFIHPFILALHPTISTSRHQQAPHLHISSPSPTSYNPFANNCSTSLLRLHHHHHHQSVNQSSPLNVLLPSGGACNTGQLARINACHHLHAKKPCATCPCCCGSLLLYHRVHKHRHYHSLPFVQ